MDENISLEFNEVTCKTVYTEELMKNYRKFTEKSSIILNMIMLAIFAAADIALLISLFIDYTKDSLILFILFFVISGISVVNLTVIPKIQIKKSPFYNAEINYEFKNDEIIVIAKNNVETTKTHLGYSEIKYVKDNGGCFYLHIGTAQAFIVEKESLQNITPEDFERILRIKMKKRILEIDM